MEQKPALVNKQKVVYHFQRDQCEAGYVGYTSRHLHQRVDEHGGKTILGDPGADRRGKGKSKRAKENGDEEKHSSALLALPFLRDLPLGLRGWGKTAIGEHMRTHGSDNSSLSRLFSILRTCKTKWDCLMFEMLFTRDLKPTLIKLKTVLK